MTEPKSYFTAGELRCKCDNHACSGGIMQPSFIAKLNHVRSTYYHKPITVSSGYRCLAHDKAVGGSGKNHPRGLAIDLIIEKGPDLMTFIQACFAVGIKRVVVYHNKPHVHIDDNPDLTPGIFVL